MSQASGRHEKRWRFETLTVLVADDCMATREVVTFILRDLNFKNIIEVSDGSTAIDVLREKPIDVIISDWNMPLMNGLDLLEWVRSRVEMEDIPFIMLTAKAYKRYVVKALQYKVSAYIVKPFTARALAKKIEEIAPPRWWE